MKLLFSLVVTALLHRNLNAQNLTYEFRMLYTQYGDSAGLYLKFCETPKAFAGIISSGEFEQKLVADKSTKNILELSKEREGDSIYKEAFKSTWDSTFQDADGWSMVYELLTTNLLEEKAYSLLPEKKTIQGFTCQKAIIKDGELKVGEGWVALGLLIGINKETGFMKIPEGTFISLKINEIDSSLELVLDKFARVVANPSAIFAMDIPADYVLQDYLEEVDEEIERDLEKDAEE